MKFNVQGLPKFSWAYTQLVFSVEAMPYNGPSGMYLNGAPDGSKPGTFQVNVLHPEELWV